MRLVEAECRLDAIAWSVYQLGLPEGFANIREYIEHTNSVMDESGYEEFYLVDSEGIKHAYITASLARDAHHKGYILYVADIVIRPESKCARELWSHILYLAEKSGCDWIARCNHDNGALRTTFRRVNRNGRISKSNQ